MKELLEQVAALSVEQLKAEEKEVAAEVEIARTKLNEAEARLRIVRSLMRPLPKVSALRDADAKAAEKKAVLEFADNYFRGTGNAPVSIKKLTSLMQAAEIKVSGKQPGTTVGAFMLRSGRFKKSGRGWTMMD